MVFKESWSRLGSHDLCVQEARERERREVEKEGKRGRWRERIEKEGKKKGGKRREREREEEEGSWGKSMRERSGENGRARAQRGV